MLKIHFFTGIHKYYSGYMHAVFQCKKDSGSTWKFRTHVKSVFFTADIFAVYLLHQMPERAWGAIGTLKASFENTEDQSEIFFSLWYICIGKTLSFQTDVLPNTWYIKHLLFRTLVIPKINLASVSWVKCQSKRGVP